MKLEPRYLPACTERTLARDNAEHILVTKIPSHTLPPQHQWITLLPINPLNWLFHSSERPNSGAGRGEQAALCYRNHSPITSDNIGFFNPHLLVPQKDFPSRSPLFNWHQFFLSFLRIRSTEFQVWQNLKPQFSMVNVKYTVLIKCIWQAKTLFMWSPLMKRHFLNHFLWCFELVLFGCTRLYSITLTALSQSYPVLVWPSSPSNSLTT